MRKRCFSKGLLVLLFLFPSLIIAQTIFTEDWESGLINPSIWEKWGLPLPEIASVGYNSNYSLDPNGNASYDSGVHTIQEFQLNGMSLSFDVKITTTTAHYEDFRIGFTDNDHNPGPSGGYSFLVYVDLHGDENNYRVHYRLPGEIYKDSYDGSWDHYEIKMRNNGHVEFYRDNELRYTSTSNIDYSLYNSQSIFISGRSVAGPVYADNIVLENISVSTEFIYGNVHCKVIDSQTKQPIMGVTIGIQDNKRQYSSYASLTNENGEADLGVSHTDILIFIQKSGYVSKIIKPGSKENTIKLDSKNNINKSRTRSDFTMMINKLLESTDYAVLSYKITQAIIDGKSFIKISNALMNQLPTGSSISIAGFFEMKLRLKNGKLGWILDGALIREFVSLGIIPTQPNSF
ncbi:MAG: hypothetical protein KAT74_03990 [Candidatus Cloacimonetes bacterium]|nr:hypothetical protein [Candidatus Cloacimonadota bacterium]